MLKLVDFEFTVLNLKTFFKMIVKSSVNDNFIRARTKSSMAI